MTSRVEVGGLRIDERLYRLVREEIAPGTGVKVDGFWQSLGAIVRDPLRFENVNRPEREKLTLLMPT